ncbi:Sodium channel protein type 8 subunit alpha [Balamuthia mandrillaris]
MQNNATKKKQQKSRSYGYNRKNKRKGKKAASVEAAPQRTEEQWKQLFEPYPSSPDGYLRSFEPEESQEYLAMLRKYGFCIVRVLSAEECRETVDALFLDVNHLYRTKRLQPQKPKGEQQKEEEEEEKVEKDDPTTWQTKRWPSGRKFLFDAPTFAAKAFENRTSENVYKTFCSIYEGREQLWCSIDKWGVARGTTALPWRHEDGTSTLVDKPEWGWDLKLHWDLNPWVYVDSLDQSPPLPPMYQGLIALEDGPTEVGCTMVVPGSAAFLPTFVRENAAPHRRWVQINVPEDHPMQRYAQHIPLRKGEMLIWDAGSAHSASANRSSKMRLYQFVRMLPATEECEERDKYAPRRIMRKYPDAVDYAALPLSDLGKKLIGLQPWT